MRLPCLEGLYDVNSFKVWNYNEVNGSFTQRGVQDVTISVASSEGGLFTPLDNFVFLQAPGTAGDFGQVVDLSSYPAADNVRLLRLDITTNWGDAGGFVGLSEIRFDGVVVPEPATCALALLGLGCCVVRRRRAA